MTEIIDLSEFVDKCSKDIEKTPIQNYLKVVKYNNLWSSDLHLGMFIPCKNGLMLHKPSIHWEEVKDKLKTPWTEEEKAYENAKGRIIFPGFEVEKWDHDWVRITNGKVKIVFKYGTFPSVSIVPIKQDGNLKDKLLYEITTDSRTIHRVKDLVGYGIEVKGI